MLPLLASFVLLRDLFLFMILRTPFHSIPKSSLPKLPEKARQVPPRLSPHCHVVWLSFVGLLMFLRLYLLMRVFRDVSSLWRYRSIIKSAAVPQPVETAAGARLGHRPHPPTWWLPGPRPVPCTPRSP